MSSIVGTYLGVRLIGKFPEKMLGKILVSFLIPNNSRLKSSFSLFNCFIKTESTEASLVPERVHALYAEFSALESEAIKKG